MHHGTTTPSCDNRTDGPPSRVHRRSVLGLAFGILVSGVGSSRAQGDVARVVAEQGWSRPTAMRVGTAVAYLRLRNAGAEPISLLRVRTSMAERVEIHESFVENGVARMRPRAGGVVLPPGEEVRFEPSGLHLMLLKPTADLKAGERFALTLEFDRGVTVDVPILVMARPPVPPPSHQGMQH